MKRGFDWCAYFSVPYGGLYDATNRSGSQFPEPVTILHIDELVDADFCKFVDLCDAISSHRYIHNDRTI